MYLRLAKIKDLKNVFNWRNDLLTRKMSHNKKILDFKDHEKWFKGQINNDKVYFLMASKNREEIGYIRFDISTIETTININLNPKFRNKNLSFELLSKSIKKFNKNKKTKYLKALIYNRNIPSKKIFEKNNFKFYENINNFNIYKLKMN